MFACVCCEAKKHLHVRVKSLIFIVLLIWLPHRLKNEQTNHSVVAWGVAHSNYYNTRLYVLFYTEKFTAFSPNRKKPSSVSHIRIVHKCRTRGLSAHTHSSHTLTLPLVHFLNMTQTEIAIRAIHIFNFANRRIFSLKIRCQFALLGLSSFRMFSVTLYLSHAVEVLISYSLWFAVTVTDAISSATKCSTELHLQYGGCSCSLNSFESN